MTVFLIVVIVVPQVDSLTLRFFVMPLYLGFKVRVLAGFAVLVTFNSVLMVTALVAKLPSLLLGNLSVLIILSVGVAVVMTGGGMQIARNSCSCSLDWRGQTSGTCRLCLINY